MTEETFRKCPWCDRLVEPDESGVHCGREMWRVDAFGSTEYVPGIGGYFHASCTLPQGWQAEPLPRRG